MKRFKLIGEKTEKLLVGSKLSSSSRPHQSLQPSTPTCFRPRPEWPYWIEASHWNYTSMTCFHLHSNSRLWPPFSPALHWSPHQCWVTCCLDCCNSLRHITLSQRTICHLRAIQNTVARIIAWSGPSPRVTFLFSGSSTTRPLSL